MAIDTSWDAPHPVGRGTVGAGPRGASVPAEWADRTVLRLDHRRADHHGVLGAGYLAAAVLEVVADRQASWTRAQVAVPSVLVFTTLTLMVTLLHLDRGRPAYPVADLGLAAGLRRGATDPHGRVVEADPHRTRRSGSGGTCRPVAVGVSVVGPPGDDPPSPRGPRAHPGRSGRPAARAPQGGGSVLAVAAHRSHGADGGPVARRPRRRSAFDGSIRSRATLKLPVRTAMSPLIQVCAFLNRNVPMVTDISGRVLLRADSGVLMSIAGGHLKPRRSGGHISWVPSACPASASEHGSLITPPSCDSFA